MSECLRFCQACRSPGRIKNGKCVERWAPGPNGPATICDKCVLVVYLNFLTHEGNRCRKRMLRRNKMYLYSTDTSPSQGIVEPLVRIYLSNKTVAFTFTTLQVTMGPATTGPSANFSCHSVPSLAITHQHEPPLKAFNPSFYPHSDSFGRQAGGSLIQYYAKNSNDSLWVGPHGYSEVS